MHELGASSCGSEAGVLPERSSKRVFRNGMHKDGEAHHSKDRHDVDARPMVAMLSMAGKNVVCSAVMAQERRRDANGVASGTSGCR